MYIYMCMYIYIYTYVCSTYMCICIYLYNLIYGATLPRNIGHPNILAIREAPADT